jgi:hypothetical protein
VHFGATLAVTEFRGVAARDELSLR